MAVVLDATGTQATINAATTEAFTGLTVGAGSDRGLVMVIAWTDDPGTVTLCRWDDAASNQNMTLIQSAVGGGGQCVKVYGLVNPISGNKTLRITWTNSLEGVINAVSWTGVNQTGGVTSFPNSTTATGTTSGGGTTNPPAVSITLPSSGAVVGIAAQGDVANLTGTSATEIVSYSGTGTIEARASQSIASGAFACTSNGNDQWVYAATGISAVGAATAVLSGTAIGGITEADVVSGGKVITITLTGDTWIAS